MQSATIGDVTYTDAPLGASMRFRSALASLRKLLVVRGVTPEAVIQALMLDLTRQWSPGVGMRWLNHGAWLSKQAEIERMAEVLRLMSFEDMTYAVSSIYALLCSEDYRRWQAMYFTPPVLTARLLDELERDRVDFATARFLDPACGGAAFLVPIARRILAARRARGYKKTDGLADHLRTHLFGMELDPVLARLCQHFLGMVVAIELGIKKQIGIDIRVGDALVSVPRWRQGVDVMASNPPYRKLDPEETATYTNHYPWLSGGQPNLYAAFMGMCLERVKLGGVVALVTPSSFLAGQSFSGLRNKLAHEGNIRYIGTVAADEGVFIDVQQETAVTVIERRVDQPIVDVTATVGIIARDGTQHEIGAFSIPISGGAWPIPKILQDADVIRAMCGSRFRLADYGYVARIGMVVWNRDKRRTFMNEDDAIAAVKDHYVPLLWASDVIRGREARLPNEPKDLDEARFIEVADLQKAPLIRRQAVLMQRVTNNRQYRRLIGSPVPRSIYRRYSGFLGENHTVILEATESPLISAKELASLLSTSGTCLLFGATRTTTFWGNSLNPVRTGAIREACVIRGVARARTASWCRKPPASQATNSCHARS